MSLGQSAANRLNQKYSQEEEDSFLQSYFKKNPLAKMGAMMSRIAMPLIPGAGAVGMLGAMGLANTANKQKENKHIAEFKAAEGLQKSDVNKTGYIADPFRSVGNAASSLSNPLMMSSVGATLAGMPELGGALMTGSMATRSPMMGLQAASGMGLTGLLSGGAANKTIENIAGKGMEGAAGSIQLGSSLLPSTLMYGAGSALSGAGSLAGMLGAGGVSEALTTGGGLMDSGAGGLLDLISSSMGAGPLGIGSLLGPGLGMLTSMALQKPVGKMMNWAHDKASGVQAQKTGGSIRPRLLSSSQLIKRYSMTSQLDNQVRSLGAQGQLDTYQWMVLSYLGAIEKPLSLLGYLSEQANKKAESDRVGGNKIQNSLQDKLSLTGDSTEDLSKAFTSPDKRGLFDLGKIDAGGHQILSKDEFMKDPAQYIKQSLSSTFLSFEKMALQASAVMNPAGWLLGGKHSVGSKLKDIRDTENKNHAANEISRITGIPTGGLRIMETTAIDLVESGNSIDEKKLALMGGTFELIRLSSFFLHDIRTALGVTKENSLLGKTATTQKAIEEASDTRSGLGKATQSTLDFIDKIPVLSLIGSVLGEGLRGWDDFTGKTSDQQLHAKGAAEDAIIGVTPINYQEEAVDLLDMIHRMLYFQLDNIGTIAEAISINTLDTVEQLDYISGCPCDGKPGMAFGGVFTEGVVPGSKQPKGHDNVLMKNVSLQSEEFVVNADASKDNRDLLHAINDNTKPRVLESIDNNIYKIVTSLTKEVSGTADATDAALEAEQAKDAKIIREISLVESVTNIEELLEKCCGAGMMGGKVKGKKGREDTFGSGVVESVIGSVVAASVAGGAIAAIKMLGKLKPKNPRLGILGIILEATGLTDMALEATGLTGNSKEVASKMINYALVGSSYGLKGAMVGAIVGLVEGAGTLLIDKFIDPKEQPKINSMAKGLLTVVEGAIIGFAAGGPVGAVAGAIAGIAWEMRDEFFGGNENYKKAEKNLEQNLIKIEKIKEEQQIKAKVKKENPTMNDLNKMRQVKSETDQVISDYLTLVKSPQWNKLPNEKRLIETQKFMKANRLKPSDEDLEILAKNKSIKMIPSKPLNINSEPKKERIFFPDNIIPNSSPTVKVETAEEIKNKTSIPVIESEKQQAKQKKQKEEELKIDKEEREKITALTEDTNSALSVVSKQIGIMTETMVILAENNSETTNGLGEVMVHTVKELQKLNGSNLVIASQSQQNKNAIIQKA